MFPENKFMLATILIVDDERHQREGLRTALEDDFDVYIAADKKEALEVLSSEPIDVVVTDLRLGADDGMDVVDVCLRQAQPPIVIMMTAYGSVDTAVEAMKRGAWHFVTKPLNLDELEIMIKRALQSRKLQSENLQLVKQVEEKFALDRMLGRSEAMRQVYEVIEQVAPSKATVLIGGESGTGKELAAHAIHNLSGRPQAKLVIVHCAALSPQLLESELFGHEKGAFTGANEKRLGRFEIANGGSIFLDEIAEIDSATQVKLLRVLGERTFERVGGHTPIKVDVRLIAATHQDLKALVAQGKFREDLYFRLNVIKVVLPPLRERKADLPLLTDAFLKEYAKENRKQIKDLSAEAQQLVLDYQWPGNVRELRSAIEHAVVMCNGNKITPRHLPESVRGLVEAPAAGPKLLGAGTGPEDLDLATMETRMIKRALEITDDNRTEAAKLLGLSRRTLQRKLQELQIRKHVP
jgi:two-component system, NtrC family, response regulator AtoC